MQRGLFTHDVWTNKQKQADTEYLDEKWEKNHRIGAQLRPTIGQYLIILHLATYLTSAVTFWGYVDFDSYQNKRPTSQLDLFFTRK